MKNFIKIISMLLVFALLAVSFVACDASSTKGEAGVNGINGVDGKDGRDGIDGKDGKDGVDGKDGKDGKSAYELAVENGFDGTLDQWLSSLKGETGDDGEAGAPGAAGAPGETGATGAPGVGIKDASVVFVEGGYKLIFTLDDGNTLEVPVIAPTKIETTSETITPDGSETPVEVAKLDNDVVVNDSNANGYTATIPAGTLLDKGTSSVTFVVEKDVDADANITINADTTATKSFNIKVLGVSEHNDMPIIVTLESALSKNLTNVALYHNGKAMSSVASLALVDADNEFYYDAATGDVTISTIGFSNFTFTHANGIEVSADTKTYTITSPAGLLWAEAQSDTFFQGKTITLGNDIDCKDYAIKPITCFNPENRTVFDGKGYTIYNLTITSNPRAEGQALFNGTLDIKNVNVDGAVIKGNRASAVLAGKIYGNIENCTVKNATVTDTYWQAGILAAQFNAGNVINCTVEDSTVYCASATGILTGITNETAGNRVYENNTVKNCSIVQTGSFGIQSGYDYDACFGAITGCIWTGNSNIYFNNCTVENCTKTNKTVENAVAEPITVLFGGPIEDGNVVYIDNVAQ